MNKFLKMILTLLSLAVASSPLSCGTKGTETGNPSMQIQFSSFSSGTVSNVSLCIHQIRFKAGNTSDDSGENTNLNVGLLTLSSDGTVIGDGSVAAGIYRRIDVMVKNQCGTGYSISIQNGSGTFFSSQPLILRFIGEVNVTTSIESLTLGITPFITFFNSVTGNVQLQSGVETVEGEF